MVRQNAAICQWWFPQEMKPRRWPIPPGSLPKRGQKMEPFLKFHSFRTFCHVPQPFLNNQCCDSMAFPELVSFSSICVVPRFLASHSGSDFSLSRKPRLSSQSFVALCIHFGTQILPFPIGLVRPPVDLHVESQSPFIITLSSCAKTITSYPPSWQVEDLDAWLVTELVFLWEKPHCYGGSEFGDISIVFWWPWEEEEAKRREEGRSVNGPEYGSHGIVSLWSPFAHICRMTAVFIWDNSRLAL